MNIVELTPVPTAEAIAAEIVVKFAPVPTVPVDETINLATCKSVEAAEEATVIVPGPFVIVIPVPAVNVFATIAIFGSVVVPISNWPSAVTIPLCGGEEV